jgi:hypothetical protein
MEQQPASFSPEPGSKYSVKQCEYVVDARGATAGKKE